MLSLDAIYNLDQFKLTVVIVVSESKLIGTCLLCS